MREGVENNKKMKIPGGFCGSFDMFRKKTPNGQTFIRFPIIKNLYCTAQTAAKSVWARRKQACVQIRREK
jgi:hypothetical protein